MLTIHEGKESILNSFHANATTPCPVSAHHGGGQGRSRANILPFPASAFILTVVLREC